MKSSVAAALSSCGLAAALAVAGCHAHTAAPPPPPAPPPPQPTFTASRIRSFSDSAAVTAIADSPTSLFVGTPHGLVRWDGARSLVLTQKEGLPDDRVAAVTTDGNGALWVATAGGVSRGLRGAWTTYAAAPVGSFLTGLVAEGRTIWAAGPDGLARLRGGRWERYFPGTGITAIVPGAGGTLWVGTSGSGVLHILRGGERLEHYGPAQGCAADVVRGLAAADRTLFVVGDGDGGAARACFFDGSRFVSYAVAAPAVIEWAVRAGTRTLLGAAAHVYALETAPALPAPDQPKIVEGPVVLTPVAASAPPAPPRLVTLRAELSAAVLDVPPPKPRRPPAAPAPPPRFYTVESPLTLPDGLTAWAGSPRGLLVGTRFLGAERIENDVPRRFRLDDLAAGAVRLTVACVKGADDCFLATGGTRAWRFDGQSFSVAAVDPEPGSHVLAMLNDPHGDVLAIHRGANDRQLRISRVDDNNRWTPIAIQAVQVPIGAPDLNFAAFAPGGHLWVGLRYVDAEGDARDWGADEIALDTGTVVTHKELPTDVVAMHWRAPNEAWFATRSGAARLLDGQVRVFTENDGMESDIARDIDSGKDGVVYVATGRGTGRYDGRRWTFPRLGAFYHPANALGHDAHGNVFIGTDKGLFCVGECAPDPIDARRGLLDDAVQDLAVDPHNRVWVLTRKGINIVEP